MKINFLGNFFYFFFYLSYWILKENAFRIVFLLFPASIVRKILQDHGADIGNEVSLSTPIQIHNYSSNYKTHFSKLHIGKNSYLGKEIFIDLAENVYIGENVTISMRSILLTHVNTGSSPLASAKLKKKYLPIYLKSGCYIGAGAIILPGIEVGCDAIVGAGAVVTRNVKEGDIVVGAPARSINGLNS